MKTLIWTLAVMTLCAPLRAQVEEELPRAFESAHEFLHEAAVQAPGQVDESFSEEMLAYFKSLPPYDLGKRGHPGDALTLIFIGEKPEIDRALRRAKWTGVPRGTPLAFVEGLGQLLAFHRITKFPPFHKYKVEGRTQKENRAQVVHALTRRHHFRLWKLNRRDPYGRQVWWGSASYDTGVRWKFIIPVTHNTSPDVDAERDYIAKTLSHEPTVMRVGLVTLPQIPRSAVNDQRDRYFTDGRALVVEFGRPIPPSAADPGPEELDETVGVPEGQ